MPHLVIQYTPDLERECDFDALCRRLADTLVTAADDAGKPVFPTGGVRVLAMPAAHHAVADGQHAAAFAYLNLRIAPGRSAAARQRVGEALAEVVRAHFEPVLKRRHVGITLQIDEGVPVFDARLGNLHALYRKD